MKKKEQILKGLRLLLQIAQGLLIIFLWTLDYESFCNTILQILGKSHRIREFQHSFLSVSTFVRFRYISLAVLGLSFIFIYFFYKRTQAFTEKILYFGETVGFRIRHKWNGFSLAEKRFLLWMSCILLLIKVFQALIIPISYDEAWTYLNFSSKSIFSSVCYYPAPNNHVLFSVFTNFTYFLPLRINLSLRFVNLILLPVIFLSTVLILKDFFENKLAILSGIFFVSSYPVALYSLQARGYLLYMWMAILAFYYLYKILTNGLQKT